MTFGSSLAHWGRMFGSKVTWIVLGFMSQSFSLLLNGLSDYSWEIPVDDHVALNSRPTPAKGSLVGLVLRLTTQPILRVIILFKTWFLFLEGESLQDLEWPTTPQKRGNLETPVDERQELPPAGLSLDDHVSILPNIYGAIQKFVQVPPLIIRLHVFWRSLIS